MSFTQGDKVKPKAFLTPAEGRQAGARAGPALHATIRWTDGDATEVEVTFETGAEPGRYLNDLRDDLGGLRD